MRGKQLGPVRRGRPRRRALKNVAAILLAVRRRGTPTVGSTGNVQIAVVVVVPPRRVGRSGIIRKGLQKRRGAWPLTSSSARRTVWRGAVAHLLRCACTLHKGAQKRRRAWPRGLRKGNVSDAITSAAIAEPEAAPVVLLPVVKRLAYCLGPQRVERNGDIVAGSALQQADARIVTVNWQWRRGSWRWCTLSTTMPPATPGAAAAAAGSQPLCEIRPGSGLWGLT